MQIYPPVSFGDGHFPAADQMAWKYDHINRNYYGCTAGIACVGDFSCGDNCNCPFSSAFYDQKIFETGMDCKK